MEQNLTSTLTALRDKAYNDAKEKGFHDKEYSDEHWLMLIVCEIAEAVEADRNDRHADLEKFERRWTMGFDNSFERYIKDTVEDELADVCIRILDFMGLRNIELVGNLEQCISAFTATRKIAKNGFEDVMFLTARCILDYKSNLIPMQYVLMTVFAACAELKFDILRHIQLKMEYNRTRLRLHGKRY